MPCNWVKETQWAVQMLKEISITGQWLYAIAEAAELYKII